MNINHVCFGTLKIENTRYLTATNSDKLALANRVKESLKWYSWRSLHIKSSILTKSLIYLFIKNDINDLTIESSFFHAPDKQKVISILSKLYNLTFKFNANEHKNKIIFDTCYHDQSFNHFKSSSLSIHGKKKIMKN